MVLTPPAQCLAAAAAYTYQLMKLILLRAAAGGLVKSLCTGACTRCAAVNAQPSAATSSDCVRVKRSCLAMQRDGCWQLQPRSETCHWFKAVVVRQQPGKETRHKGLLAFTSSSSAGCPPRG
jgi:hypothetical protein